MSLPVPFARFGQFGGKSKLICQVGAHAQARRGQAAAAGALAGIDLGGIGATAVLAAAQDELFRRQQG